MVLSLFGAFLLLFGIALVKGEGNPLPPLPTADGDLFRGASATTAGQAELERAGYVFEDKSSRTTEGGRTLRTYAVRASGSSFVLRDERYPPGVSIRRELSLAISSVEQGLPREELPKTTSRLVAAAETSIRRDPAALAGFAYLARVSGSEVEPEALRNAVVEYLRQYRQPSTAVQEVCAGCEVKNGFGDEYAGGGDMHTPLRHGWPGWEIAGIRHYLDGESAFTVEVTVSVPRS